jgi:hypothetical protein
VDPGNTAREQPLDECPTNAPVGPGHQRDRTLDLHFLFPPLLPFTSEGYAKGWSGDERFLPALVVLSPEPASIRSSRWQ